MKKKIQVARGQQLADLVLKNANIVNVFSEQVETGDVAIVDGEIVGVGVYCGAKEIDCTDRYVAPGFIDGHIHLESSMMRPSEFARVVVPRGTTTVVTDPHEITNVCGTAGIDYMLEATEGLPLDVYVVLPSCVPATALDESGAVLHAEDLRPYYGRDRVLGLAEMMNYPGVLAGDPDVLQKLSDAREHDAVIDGHAPGLTEEDLCAYITAGVKSDHECSRAEEALERIRRGQWLMIREGTAAKNLEALMPAFSHPYAERAMLATDDKHPGDLLKLGHIDYILKRAVSLGANPCTAIRMATRNAAEYFRLYDRGAVAPGYRADVVILEDLKEFHVLETYRAGRQVASDGRVRDFSEPVTDDALTDCIYHSFHMRELKKEDFHIHHKESENKIRVIALQEGQILTDEFFTDYVQGHNGVDPKHDILKLAVIERHHNSGHMGLGYIKGYGLKNGAIASTVSHDSHNLIIVGTNETDMYVAANAVREMQGGWVVTAGGEVIAQLPLSIAGLMSALSAPKLAACIEDMKEAARVLGVSEGIDPYMTLAFASLPVIPKIRLTTRGLVDVDRQEFIGTGAFIESGR